MLVGACQLSNSSNVERGKYLTSSISSQRGERERHARAPHPMPSQSCFHSFIKQETTKTQTQSSTQTMHCTWTSLSPLAVHLDDWRQSHSVIRQYSNWPFWQNGEMARPITRTPQSVPASFCFRSTFQQHVPINSTMHAEQKQQHKFEGSTQHHKQH
jgi:hypothetical protein